MSIGEISLCCLDDLIDADLPDALPCACMSKSFQSVPLHDRFAYVIESLPTVPAARCACEHHALLKAA